MGTAYGRTGFGYLRKTITGWNSAARGVPFVVLVDLDLSAMPKVFDRILVKAPPQHPNLLVRIAVREVESWLLADAANLSSYLSISARWVPDDPDNLPDPKQALINLAARSRSADIRSRLVPKQGSTARQGRDHNSLSTFVNSAWDVDLARSKSPSLRTDRKRPNSPLEELRRVCLKCPLIFSGHLLRVL